MARGKIERALADWPKTDVAKEGGVHITGRYVPPWIAANYDGMWALMTAIIVIALGGAWTQLTNNGACFFVVGVFMMVLYLPIKYGLFRLFGGNVDVRVFPDTIQMGGKTYSRQMPIEFRVEQHQKGLKEQLRENKTGKRKPRTYRDALEVVMQYGEKRVPIAALPLKDIALAHALVIRLQNVCNSLDEIVRRFAAGQVAPAQGSGEFGPAPEVR